MDNSQKDDDLKIENRTSFRSLKSLANYFYLEQIIAIFMICLIVLLPVSFVDAISIKYTPGKNSVVFDVDTNNEQTKVSIKYHKRSESASITKTDPLASNRHFIQLEPLEPQTAYEYKVNIFKNNNNNDPIATASNEIFITLDEVDPIKITGLKSESVTRNSVKLSWDTVTPNQITYPTLPRDNDFDKYIIYRWDENTNNYVKIAESSTNEYVDLNLAASATYRYAVSERDRVSEEGPLSSELEVTTLDPDITAPEISEPKMLALTDTSANIEITADEESNISLSYGILPQNYDKEQVISAFKKQHAVSLINLIKNQEYFYTVKVCDSSGNCLVSNEFSFITGSDVTPPVINAVIPRYVNEANFRITGSTEALATVELYVNDKRIARIDSNLPTQNFSLPASNLDKSKVNKLKLVATDLAGNKAELEGEVEVDDQAPEIKITTRIAPQLQAGQSSPVDDPENTAIEGIPSKLARNELEIDGFSNEAVTITYSTSDINEKPAKTDNPDAAAESNLVKTIEANGPFKLVLQLTEGNNPVTITATDKANTKVVFKKDVFVDTIAPVILEPTDLSFYSPSYLPALEIKGKVDTPGATVIILVKGKCSGNAIPTSLSGIVIKATKDYKCKVIADPQGNFNMKIELDKTGFSPDTDSKQLDLSKQGYGKGDYGGKGEASTGTKLYDYQFDPKAVTRNEIRIIAIDENGLQSKEIKDVIEYRACGESGAWQIDIPAAEFTPTIIYSEHLIRGFAQFGFNMYFKYQGAGDPKDARILSPGPTITELELSEADQKNFGHSQLLTKPQTTWSDDYKTGHALYTLAKWSKTEEELKKVKKLKLPLMIEFSYSQNIYGEERQATQKTCIDQTTIELEPRLAVEGKIPEAFLNDAIATINNTLDVINQILEPLQKLQAVLMFSCMGSWIVLWIWNTIYVRWSCLNVWDNARGSLALEEHWVEKGNVDFPTCDALSDEDKSTCTSCMQKMQKFRKWDMRMHLLCDRVFCPSVPDLNVHKRVTRDVYLAGIGGKLNACEGKTEDFYFKNEENVLDSAKGGYWNLPSGNDACKNEYVRTWENTCLGMNEWKEATTNPDKKDAWGKVFSAVADMCKPKPANKDKLVRQPIKDKDGNVQYQEFISKDGKFYENPQYIERQELTPEQEQRDDMITIGEGSTTKKYKIDKNKGLKLGYNREGKSTDRLFIDKDNDGKISDLEIYNDTNNNRQIDDAEAKDSNYLEDNTDVSNNKALQDEFEPPGEYIVDPTSGIIRAAQCVCVPAIVAYLTFWKGALDAVKKCFQSVLITKKAQNGLCKSVLTVYICDMIYDVISCITKKYSAGAGTQVKADGIGGFFAAMSGASNDVQNSVVNRYGESAIYKTMFSERKLIHALCVGAFTGDWDIDIQNLIQGQVKIPIASQGWVPTATRRFVTADPNNDGLATYIYHIGAGMIAGSDVDWSLELICSNNNDCNQIDNDADNHACDCAQGSRPGEQAIRIDGGRLRSGESIGGTDEQGDRYLPLTQRIRYDKVRLRWSYKDNNGKTQTDEIVNPIAFTGGTPPVNCNFDAAEASYHCQAAVGELGTFKFVEKPRPKKQLYTINDQIKLDAQIIKKSPNYKAEYQDARIAGTIGIQTSGKTDPKKQIPKWVVFTLFNQHNSIVNVKRGAASEPVKEILQLDGTYSTEVQATGAETDGLKIDWLLPDSFRIEERDFLKLVGTGSVSTMPVKDSDNNIKTELSISPQPPIRGDTVEKATLVIAEKKGAENFCTTKKIKSYTNDPVQSSRHIIVKEVDETNIIQSKKCTKGTALRADPGGNIIVVIGDVKDQDFADNAQYAVIYKPDAAAINTQDSACKTGEKVQWRLEMELHHGLKEYENLDWSADNFKTNAEGEIAQSKGKPQTYRGNDAIMIDVVCSQNAGAAGQGSSNNDCNPDPITGKVAQLCTCNLQSKERCGGVSLNQYCYGINDIDTNCRKTPHCPENTEITPTTFPTGCVCKVDGNTNKPGDCGITGATDNTRFKYCYAEPASQTPSCHENPKSAQQTTTQPTAPAQPTRGQTVRIGNKDWYVGQEIILNNDKNNKYTIVSFIAPNTKVFKIRVKLGNEQTTSLLNPSDFEDGTVTPISQTNIDTTQTAYG